MVRLHRHSRQALRIRLPVVRNRSSLQEPRPHLQGPFDGPNARSSDYGDADHGVFAVDCQSRILAWSKGVEALLGRTAEDAIGEKCYDVMGGRLLSGKRVCCADCAVKQRARRKASLRDFDLVVKDGRGQHRVLTVSTSNEPGHRASHDLASDPSGVCSDRAYVVDAPFNSNTPDYTWSIRRP